MSPSAALAGLRVLDLTNLFAAPQVAATLADFGADVVKIEPRNGDPLRQIGSSRNGGSPAWALVARNKRAITLDLDHAAGMRVFEGLVEQADVLIENLTAKLLERWQCDFASLLRRNPKLVVVSISCYGRSGPNADRAGAGTLAEAFAGFAHMNGASDGPPTVPSLPLGDTLVGMSGVIGTMMALYSRDRAGAGSGAGQHVDVSMIEPVLQLLALPLANHVEGETPPRRSPAETPRTRWQTPTDGSTRTNSGANRSPGWPRWRSCRRCHPATVGEITRGFYHSKSRGVRIGLCLGAFTRVD